MRGKIAVDDELGNVRQALADAGYEVVGIEEPTESADVVVLSGMTQDMAGYQGMQSDSAVVNAAGMSAEDVVVEVGKRLRKRL
ncbi:MAG: YkuS family protein [Limnochordia bacterium]|jgi:hypothetical protein